MLFIRKLTLDEACLSVYMKHLWRGSLQPSCQCPKHPPPPPLMKSRTLTYGMKLKLTPEIPLEKDVI